MTTGRNDPCPCGSGKKYKRCHGVAQPPAAARALAGGAPRSSPGRVRPRIATSHDVRAPAASPGYAVDAPAGLPDYRPLSAASAVRVLDAPGSTRDPAHAPNASPRFAVYAPVASPDTLLQAARKCLEGGDAAGAEALYRDVLEQQPDH